MSKNTKSNKESLIKATLKAEWGSPAGKANVLFVGLLLLFTIGESVVIKGLNYAGAYISTCFTRQTVLPFTSQASTILIYWTIALMFFCPLLMFCIEVWKNKVREKMSGNK